MLWRSEEIIRSQRRLAAKSARTAEASLRLIKTNSQDLFGEIEKLNRLDSELSSLLEVKLFQDLPLYRAEHAKQLLEKMEADSNSIETELTEVQGHLFETRIPLLITSYDLALFDSLSKNKIELQATLDLLYKQLDESKKRLSLLAADSNLLKDIQYKVSELQQRRSMISSLNAKREDIQKRGEYLCFIRLDGNKQRNLDTVFGIVGQESALVAEIERLRAEYRELRSRPLLFPISYATTAQTTKFGGVLTGSLELQKETGAWLSSYNLAKIDELKPRVKSHVLAIIDEFIKSRGDLNKTIRDLVSKQAELSRAVAALQILKASTDSLATCYRRSRQYKNNAAYLIVDLERAGGGLTAISENLNSAEESLRTYAEDRYNLAVSDDLSAIGEFREKFKRAETLLNDLRVRLGARELFNGSPAEGTLRTKFTEAQDKLQTMVIQDNDLGDYLVNRGELQKFYENKQGQVEAELSRILERVSKKCLEFEIATSALENEGNVHRAEAIRVNNLIGSAESQINASLSDFSASLKDFDGAAVILKNSGTDGALLEFEAFKDHGSAIQSRIQKARDSVSEGKAFPRLWRKLIEEDRWKTSPLRTLQARRAIASIDSLDTRFADVETRLSQVSADMGGIEYSSRRSDLENRYYKVRELKKELRSRLLFAYSMAGILLLAVFWLVKSRIQRMVMRKQLIDRKAFEDGLGKGLGSLLDAARDEGRPSHIRKYAVWMIGDLGLRRRDEYEAVSKLIQSLDSQSTRIAQKLLDDAYGVRQAIKDRMARDL